MILVMRCVCVAMMPAFLATSAGSTAFFSSWRARPPMTLSGVPTSWAMPAASWPMVASFSEWRRRASRASLASTPWRISSRASRSEPVMSLKRSARSPTSSSRSRRMTRPRSPWVTSSMASTSRLSGLEMEARVDSQMSAASRTERPTSAQMTVLARLEHGARHVVLVAGELEGGDDAVLIVAHRLHERVDWPCRRPRCGRRRAPC